MIKNIFALSFLVFFLIGYYYLFYVSFVKKDYNSSSPILKKRLGNILWDANQNSSDGRLHTYCYYPGGNISYAGKGNEYIVKRVSSIKNCEGWYGILVADNKIID